MNHPSENNWLKDAEFELEDTETEPMATKVRFRFSGRVRSKVRFSVRV